MKFSMFLFLVFFLAVAPVPAKALTPSAEVQQLLPAFRLADQTGAEQSLETLVGEQGLVLVFVRSVDWCPYCKNQVKDFQARFDDFKTLGFHVAVVSYDSQEKTNAFAKASEISFPLLSDTNSGLIRAAGILDTQHAEGSRFYGIPKPTVFILNSEGNIEAQFAEESYKDRPDIDNILQMLRQLVGR